MTSQAESQRERGFFGRMVAAAAALWRVEPDSRAFIAGKNTRQKEVGREIVRARQLDMPHF